MKDSYGFDKIPIEQIYSAGYCASINGKKIVEESGIENAAVYVVGTPGFK